MSKQFFSFVVSKFNEIRSYISWRSNMQIWLINLQFNTVEGFQEMPLISVLQVVWTSNFPHLIKLKLLWYSKCIWSLVAKLLFCVWELFERIFDHDLIKRRYALLFALLSPFTLSNAHIASQTSGSILRLVFLVNSDESHAIRVVSRSNFHELCFDPFANAHTWSACKNIAVCFLFVFLTKACLWYHCA